MPGTGLEAGASIVIHAAGARLVVEMWVGLDIIRAAGALRSLSFEEEMELSCGSGAVEFVAKMLKVFPANLQLKNFLDHRREVRQGTDDSERSCIGRPRRTPRRRKDQRILDRFQQHATLIQLVCKETIRAAHHARSAGHRAIGFEKPSNVLALFHRR